MGGVIGRSGRKTHGKEVRVGILAGMSVEWAIKKWDQFEDSDKMKIFLALAPRYIPAEIKNPTPVEVKIHINEIALDERKRLVNQRLDYAVN